MTMYRRVVRPVLFRLDAETAHNLGKWGLQRRHAWQLMESLHRYEVDDPRLRTNLAGIVLRNPVGLTAGLDKDARMLDAMQALGFGYATAGSIRGEAAGDNPKPRVLRYASEESIINSTGFPSKGSSYAARRLCEFRRSPRRTLVVNANVTGYTIDEVVRAAIDVEQFADTIELSLSCPNTTYAESADNFLDPKTLARLIDNVLPQIHVPLFVKIRPFDTAEERGERLRLVEVCAEHGVNGLQMAGGQVWDEPRLALGKGNVSGRLMIGRCLSNLRDVYAIVGDSLTIKASGGISSAEDAYTAIAAGASTVELLTALIYEGPTIARRINQGLLDLMDKDGVANLASHRGSAYKQ